MPKLLLHGWKLAEGEALAMGAAATVLASELTAESGQDWEVRAKAVLSPADCDRTAGPAVLVTSLIGEIDSHYLPWPETETRLRDRYATLASDPALTIFVCTILRHVPADMADAPARLVRLRRLNLLAIELSRALGIHVIDIDRALADIGARMLATDYRLSGIHGIAAAANNIAVSLLAAGFDDLIAYPLQDAVRARIAGRPPQLAEARGAPLPARIDRPLANIVTVRTGRGVGRVAMNHNQNESRARMVLRLVRRRQVGVREMVRIGIDILKRNGVQGTTRKLSMLGPGAVKRVLRKRASGQQQ